MVLEVVFVALPVPLLLLVELGLFSSILLVGHITVVVDISFLMVSPGVMVASLLLLQVEGKFLVVVASVFFQVHLLPFLVHSSLVVGFSKVYP